MSAGVIPQFLNDPSELVYAAAVFCRPMAPHLAVDARKVGIFLRKLRVGFYLSDKFLLGHFRPLALFRMLHVHAVWVVVPNVHFVINEIFYVRLPGHETVEFMENAFPVDALCRKQGKPFAKVESYLPAEKPKVRLAVPLVHLPVAILDAFTHQVEILLFRMSRAHTVISF